MGRPYRHYENRVLRKYFQTSRRLDVQGEGGCDGKNEQFAIELFQRDIPKYISEELEQAENDSLDDKTREPLLPIAVMREKHKQDDDAVVIMRLSDFMELVNGTD